MITLRRLETDAQRDATSWPPQLLALAYFVRNEGEKTSVYQDVRVSYSAVGAGEWTASLEMSGPARQTPAEAMAELGRQLERIGQELQKAKEAPDATIPLQWK